MTVLAYPLSASLTDYARAITGGALTGVPLLAIETVPAVTALLATGVALFALYAAITTWRLLLRVEMTEAALIVRGPKPRIIHWSDLCDLRLAYYTTRRDRTDGWLELKLRDRRGRLTLDSRLRGFSLVAERAAREAALRSLHLDASSLHNLRTLGIACVDPYRDASR